MHKKVFNICLLVSLLILMAFQTGSFKDSQLKYKRVKTAYDKKWQSLQKLLAEKGIKTNNFEVLLRAFKEEKQLEIWCRNKGEKKYALIKTIAICASSGELGPKRKEGDGQVPEGFYQISAFNPVSNYHLALKVNYPNQSDKLKGKGRLGGDIMIHGNCVTIGCIPLQDEPIEELYVLCVESKNSNNDINVFIAPCRLSENNFNNLNKLFVNDTEKTKLWATLKAAHKYFEDNHYLPKISVDKQGDYQLSNL